MLFWRALVGRVGLGVGLGVAACSHPPPRLSVELSARATAKAGVVSLVVADPVRAERLHAIYLEVVTLAHELDRSRLAARAQCRAQPERRAKGAAANDPIVSGALECLLAPPSGESRALVDRYALLMLEARALLTQREFEKLARMR